MERYRHGAGVVTYLARYLRGGPIKNARLVAWDGERVTFTYRTRHEKADGARRPADDVARGGLSPAVAAACAGTPDPGGPVYGLYHQTRLRLDAVPGALGQPPVVVPVDLDWQTVCAQRGRPIRSGVRPVGSCSYARVSSHEEGLLRRPGWRSALHEHIRTAEDLPGAWCAWWRPGDGSTVSGQYVGGHAPARHCSRVWVGWAAPAAWRGRPGM